MKKNVLLCFMLLFSVNCIHSMLIKSRLLQRLAQHEVLRRYAQKNVSTTSVQFQELQNNFPPQVLQRYKKEYKLSKVKDGLQGDVQLEDGYFEHLRDEWIRYVLLSKVNRVPYCMFSKEVDDFWHTFLLFTREYEHYFTLLSGGDGKILHHVPHQLTSVCPQTCQWKQKKQFRDAYQEKYGDDPMYKQLWSALRPCCSSCAKTSIVVADFKGQASPSIDATSAALVGTLAVAATAIMHHDSLSKPNDYAIKRDLPSCGSSSSGSNDGKGSGRGGGCCVSY